MSKVSNHSIGKRPQLALTPIFEDSSSNTYSNFTISKNKAFFAMGDFVDLGEQMDPQSTWLKHINRVWFNIKLVFAKESKYGAKLYHQNFE